MVAIEEFHSLQEMEVQEHNFIEVHWYVVVIRKSY